MTRLFRAAPLSRSAAALLCGILIGWPTAAGAQKTAEREVTATVRQFLSLIGRQELDSLPPLFAPGASIASAALRNGRWVTASQSFDSWLAALHAAPRGRPYVEPVRAFTVHVSAGQLAFVRAEADLIQDGTVRAHNTDYFTLLRASDGRWHFVNGSYTTRPVSRR